MANQFFFGSHLGGGHLDFLETFSRRDFFCVFDAFLLFNNRTFHSDSLSNHFLNVAFFDFDRFFFFDIGNTDHAFAFGHFQVAIALNTFNFNRIGFLFVSLGDQDLASFVFLGDSEFFFGRDPRTLGFQSLLFFDLLGCSTFTS